MKVGVAGCYVPAAERYRETLLVDQKTHNLTQTKIILRWCVSICTNLLTHPHMHDSNIYTIYVGIDW